MKPEQMTKEQLTETIARSLRMSYNVNAQNLFNGFETPTVAAILQFGARKEELVRMYHNVCE